MNNVWHHHFRKGCGRGRRAENHSWTSKMRKSFSLEGHLIWMTEFCEPGYKPTSTMKTKVTYIIKHTFWTPGRSFLEATIKNKEVTAVWNAWHISVSWQKGSPHSFTFNPLRNKDYRILFQEFLKRIEKFFPHEQYKTACFQLFPRSRPWIWMLTATI